MLPEAIEHFIIIRTMLPMRRFAERFKQPLIQAAKTFKCSCIKVEVMRLVDFFSDFFFIYLHFIFMLDFTFFFTSGIKIV